MATDDQGNSNWNLNIKFTKAGVARTFVPLNVPDHRGNLEPAFFTFNYSLVGEYAESLLFEIIDDQDTIVYKRLETSFDHEVSGARQFQWDGFDLDDIYDSGRFNGHIFVLRITARKGGLDKSFSKRFQTKYKAVDWVDIRIDRKSRVVKATLRTDFKDGVSRRFSAPGKTFSELLSLAQEGLQYHWGRNRWHPAGKNIKISNGDTYEFYLNTENTGLQAISSPKIVFQTNARSRRSRNWELSRILFYNTGRLYQAGRWYHKASDKADAEFKFIAAHEIGHEILLAFGGHMYSKTHKSSSTLVTQQPLGNFIYPESGEIDLMIYYADDEQHPCPRDYLSRSVASEMDVLGLIWLSKLEIKQ